MRIAHRGICHEDARLIAHPAGESLGTELIELLLRAAAGRLQRQGRQLWKLELRRARSMPRLRVAVHDRLADERQEARSTVPLARPLEELRSGLDEARRVVARSEARMGDQLVEEAQVGCDSADTELPQRAMHACDGLLRRRGPGGDLH